MKKPKAAGIIIKPRLPIKPKGVMIELEPDMFRVGSDVSNLFEGVTLQRISNYPGASSANVYNHNSPLSPTPIYSSVYIEAPTYGGSPSKAPTGSHTFGTFRRPTEAPNCWSGAGCASPPTGFSALMVQFDNPTNYFEIAGAWQSDEHIIYAFDTNGQSVGGVTSRSPLWENGPFTADIAKIGSLARAPFIKTLFVGGWENPALLDRIRFNRVP